jgi:hypothetical protein
VKSKPFRLDVFAKCIVAGPDELCGVRDDFGRTVNNLKYTSQNPGDCNEFGHRLICVGMFEPSKLLKERCAKDG